jgi:hypothetical protein
MLLLAMLLAASPAPRPTAVRWTAPAECPDASSFARALAFRTDKVALVGPGEAPTAWLEAVVTRARDRYAGVISVRLPSGATTRTVSGRRCESVVEALSLIAALLVDPENARTSPLPPEVLQPVPEPPPVEVPVAPVPEPKPPAPEQVPEPSAPALDPAPAMKAVASVEPVAPVESPWRVRLLVAAHGTTAISGLFDVGGHAGVSVERGPFVGRVALGAGGGAMVQSSIGRARYPFHLLTSLEAGAGLQRGPLFGEATLCATLLAFTVTSVDAAAPAVVWRWILPVGPALRAGLALGAFRLGASVQAGLNVRRDTYVVTPDGEVFTTPLLFVHPAVFVSYTL